MFLCTLPKISSPDNANPLERLRLLQINIGVRRKSAVEKKNKAINSGRSHPPMIVVIHRVMVAGFNAASQFVPGGGRGIENDCEEALEVMVGV